MARETAATRKTLERNLRRGRWVLVGDYDPTRSIYYVTVPKARKTLAAGRTMMVSIHETPGETKERVQREQEEKLAYIRSLKERQNG